MELININCIQRFMYQYAIVTRRQTGKLHISPEKKEIIKNRVPFFLGTVARQMKSEMLCVDNIENADQKHFIIKMDDGITLGFCDDQTVKYADVTSGGEGMTM